MDELSNLGRHDGAAQVPFERVDFVDRPEDLDRVGVVDVVARDLVQV